MSRSTLTSKANRAIDAAQRGGALVDRIEADEGCALSTVLDGLWAEADEQGIPELSARLERAYNRLTG